MIFELKGCLPRNLQKHNHPQPEGQLPAQGKRKPLSAAREKEFAVTLKDQQRLSIEAVNTVSNLYTGRHCIS